MQATEVFLYQDLSVGVSALLMGGGSSPELQADLHVKGRCSQEAVGPTGSEMTRVKGCQWDAQSLNWNLLSDEVLIRLLGKITLVHVLLCPSSKGLAMYLRACLQALRVVYNPELNFCAFYFYETIFIMTY